jgi:hypothetical protein
MIGKREQAMLAMADGWWQMEGNFLVARRVAPTFDSSR